MEDIDNKTKDTLNMECTEEVIDSPPIEPHAIEKQDEIQSTTTEETIESISLRYESSSNDSDDTTTSKSSRSTTPENDNSSSPSTQSVTQMSAMSATSDLQVKDESKSTTPKPISDKMSRELKSLIAAAKESNLDTNIIHKRHSLPEQSGQSTPSDTRRISTENNTSNSGLEAQSTPVLSASKRIMRSQNPEFAAKHQKFMSKVTGVDVDLINDKEVGSPNLKRKRERDSVSPDGKSPKKHIKVETVCALKDGQDAFCWQCHKDKVQIQCMACTRSFHQRCLKNAMPICESWTCSECMTIMQAENPDTRSYARRKLNDKEFMQVLRFALKRMIGINGAEPFMHPVDTDELNDYLKYVVTPMDLSVLSENIDKNLYKSTDAFQADAKWILHNSVIYNSSQSKLTSIAKSIVKTCRIEMAEIETCPECYINANTQKDTWFIEVCSKPHILVWAKLKGFPFWPAKAVNVNDSAMVDVRFFGAHDKAWVPVKDVYLYSSKDPNIVNKHQKNNIAESIKEVDLHIEKIIQRFGEFIPATIRTPFEPENLQHQLQQMLPNYQPNKSDGGMVAKRTTIPKKSRKTIKDHFDSDSKKNRSISRNGLSRRSSLNNSILDDEVGYGTEEDDDTTPNVTELRLKLSKLADTMSEEDSDKSDEEIESTNTSNISSGLKTPKVRKRGLSTLSTPSIKIGKKRRDSEISNSSDLSRVSEKKVETEKERIKNPESSPKEIVKSKPIIQVIPTALVATNTEIRISPKTKEIPNEIIETVKPPEITNVPIDEIKKITQIEKVKQIEASVSSNSSNKSVDSQNHSDNEPEVEPEVKNVKPKTGVKLVTSQKRKSIVKESNKVINEVTSDKKPVTRKSISAEESQKVIKPSTDSSKKVSKIVNKQPSPIQITAPPTKPEQKRPASLDPSIEIKEEVIDSEDEHHHADKNEFFPALSLSPNVTLSVVEKQLLKKRTEATQNATGINSNNSTTTDNLTKTIENVAKGAGKSTSGSVPQKKTELKVISVAEINQKKQISLDRAAGAAGAAADHSTQVNKQKARKSFPNRPPPSLSTAIAPKKLKHIIDKFGDGKDKMVYIPQNNNKIALIPPNMTYTSVPTSTKFIVPQSMFSGLTTTTCGGTLVTGGNMPLLTLNTPVSTTQTIPIAPRPSPVQSNNTHNAIQTEEERNNAEGLPILQLRPSGPILQGNETPDSSFPSSSTSGAFTQIINRSSAVMTDFFKTMLTDAIKDLGEMGSLEAKVKEQQLEIERLKYKLQEDTAQHKLQITTLKQGNLMERQRALQELKSTMDMEKQRAVEEAKAKQWCAMCLKESQYRCCWSTSYCSYSCQRNHWTQHQSKCQQSAEQRAQLSNNILNDYPSMNDVGNKNNSNNDRNRNESNPIKPIKHSYPGAKQTKNVPIAKGPMPGKTGEKINLITSKAGPGTLHFVQNSTGGIELVNHGPIALGGKLIPTSQFSSKIKGYIVSSNATLTPSTAPALTTIPTKSLSLGSGGNSTFLSTPPLVSSSSILKPIFSKEENRVESEL